MTELVPLRDYRRSRAVLIGVWDYEDLPPVPAARNSLLRMERTLTGPLCGWPTDRVEVLSNVPRRGDLGDHLMGLFGDATDVAMFYFVGHGQLHGDELCLALRESPSGASGRRKTVGLAFGAVRDALHECDAETKIVILDCCFSGRATMPGNSLDGRGTDLMTMTTGTGAFTMAASGAFNTAWFDTDLDAVAPQTYFTRYLLDTIEQGLPGHGDGIALGPLFRATAEALGRDRKPRPTRSVRDEADGFVLARNAISVRSPLIPGETFQRITLPQELRAGLDSGYPRLQVAAIQELADWLTDPDPAKANAARSLLEEAAVSDRPLLADAARAALRGPITRGAAEALDTPPPALGEGNTVVGINGLIPTGPAYCTGDIHGHSEQLDASLFQAGITDAKGNWAAGSAWLWFLGGLFGSGPDGIGVIETVMRLQRQAPKAGSGGRVDCLLSEHEVKLLAAYRLRGPGTAKFHLGWLAEGQQRDLWGLTKEHALWLEGLPAMALIDDHLLIHSDTVAYRELGTDIESVNAKVRSTLRNHTDFAAWDHLIALLAGRSSFTDGGKTAMEFLAEFGGAQLVHGHSPIPEVWGIPVEDVTGPMIYADGRAVNIDTGTAMGGPYLVNPFPTARLTT